MHLEGGGGVGVGIEKPHEAVQLVAPELRTESKSPSYGISFLLQGAMNEVENSVCVTEQPEMMTFLLWTVTSVFGIIYVLLGYRFLRIVGFLSGIAAGSGCILWIQKQEIAMLGDPTDSVIAVIAGLVGAVMGSTHPIASALVSAFAGAIVSSVVMAFCVVSLPHHDFGEREIVVAICGGAVIFAVLTLSCTKMVTIVTSSIVGATMIILAVDFFMHDLATLKWMIKIHPNPSPPPCWGGIIVFMWPVVMIVGVLVQSFITAWHVDHKKPHFHHQPLQADKTGGSAHRNLGHHPNLNAFHGPPMDPNAANRARMAGNNNNRMPETKEEARTRKYRYLYRVRTAHGDIISKNYVSALQRNIQPSSPGPSTSTKTGSHERDTFRSDRTRMTNLMDTNSAERDRTTLYFDH